MIRCTAPSTYDSPGVLISSSFALVRPGLIL
jgi:hypothetical protein